jgi:hypothetical protein
VDEQVEEEEKGTKPAVLPVGVLMVWLTVNILLKHNIIYNSRAVYTTLMENNSFELLPPRVSPNKLCFASVCPVCLGLCLPAGIPLCCVPHTLLLDVKYTLNIEGV